MILVMSVAAVLLAAIGGEIYVRLKSPYGYVTPEILRSRRQYRINVQTFVDVARNAGAVPVLVTEARLVSKKNEDADRKRINYEMVLLTHEALYHAFKEEDRILREISNEKQVHLTDSSAVLSGRSEFFLDAVHLTDRGSEALSSIVATSIASLLNNPARPAADHPGIQTKLKHQISQSLVP